MFIIYGTKTTSKKLGEPLPIDCRFCGKVDFFERIRYTRWWSFFFMPIIPLSREYFLSCPTCESGWQIDSKDNVKALRKLGKVSARYQKQKINIDQFAKHIDTFYENHDLE